MKIKLIALICIIGTYGFAQEGYTIEFDQIMETEDSLLQESIDMMGDISTVWYFNNSSFRSESSMGMAGTTTVIFNGTKKESLMLMENPFLGNSYLFIEDTEEEDPKLSIIKTNSKKNIAGYNCVKYIITDSSGSETIAYVTDEIIHPYKNEYSDEIEGLMLCTISVSKEMGAEIKVTMIATNVTVGEIGKEKFDLTIPEGYTEFQYEE